MRPDEFTPQSPGQLVPIPGGVAFNPDRLPPAVPPSWEVAARLDRAGRALARLSGVAQVVPNHDLLIRPLLTREAIESNRLEGTHTVAAQVLLQEAGGPPSDLAVAANNLEVIRYIETARLGQQWLADGRPLASFFLRALHGALLEGTRGENRHPGSFRAGQVLIGQGGDSPLTARFVPPPPELVPGAIEDLVAFASADESYPPLVSAAITHYQFETIHPFEDGNGRLGRLLIPLQLIARGVIELPIVNLSPFFEARRETYLSLLKGVSLRGEWEAWIRFFLSAVEDQADDARRRADTLLDLHGRYRALVRASTRSQAPLVALDLIVERVIVSAADVARFASCADHTARSALAQLQGLGIVRPMTEGYPQRWIAHEILSQLYEP